MAQKISVISGINGKVILTDSFGKTQNLPVSWWDAVGAQTYVPIANINTTPYFGIVPNMKEPAQLSFGGYWRPTFNPFFSSPSTGGSTGLKLGAFVGLKYYTFSQLTGFSDTYLSAPTCFVHQYHVSPQVDGLCEYSFILITSGVYYDFSGQPA